MKKAIILAALLLAVVVSAVSAADGQLVFATNAEFPPFEYVTPSGGVIGEFDGIEMEIAKAIADEMGVEPVINNMEFDSVLISLQSGSVDAAISGITITEERAESVDFTIPYFVAKQVMIVKEDSDIQKATDMVDKKIVVIQGYTGELCVQDLGYPYEAFKKDAEAILELKNGKCDVVVLDNAVALHYVNDVPGLKIVEDDENFEIEEYGIAVKKGSDELLATINGVLEKLLADGSIDEWTVKYGSVD